MQKSKKVLIISTSLRKGSNSEILAKKFMEGAKINNEVEFISLKNKDIKFCKGCLSCQKKGKCIIKDDANEITDKIKNSDVIVWATPIYYYEMSGTMKTLIDRANSLYASDYKFREVYLITTSTDSSKNVIDSVIHGVKGWISCFDDVEFSGYLDGGGLSNPNDAKANEKLLVKAFNMGKKV